VAEAGSAREPMAHAVLETRPRPIRTRAIVRRRPPARAPEERGPAAKSGFYAATASPSSPRSRSSRSESARCASRSTGAMPECSRPARTDPGCATASTNLVCRRAARSLRYRTQAKAQAPSPLTHCPCTLGCRISRRQLPFVVDLSNDRGATNVDSACGRGGRGRVRDSRWRFLQRRRLMRQPHAKEAARSTARLSPQESECMGRGVCERPRHARQRAVPRTGAERGGPVTSAMAHRRGLGGADVAPGSTVSDRSASIRVGLAVDRGEMR
jgi:hypothetical protein